MTDTSTEKKIWLVTGCSSGLGLLVAQAALARGDKVVATARKLEALHTTLTQSGNCKTLVLDVTSSQADLDKKAAQAVALFGRIDVLVNNAGYVQSGVWEHVSHEDICHQFETNVFGPLRLTRSIMPYMRQNGGGKVMFMSSVTGWVGVAAGGPYSASKFALEGAAECLRLEINQFNIQTHLIVLGMFRTDVLSSDRRKLESGSGTSEYASVIEGYTNRLTTLNGKQPGDPNLAAQRVVDLARNEGHFEHKSEVPFRIFLGSDCSKAVQAKCQATLQSLEEFEDLTGSTDFREDMEKA